MSPVPKTCLHLLQWAGLVACCTVTFHFDTCPPAPPGRSPALGVSLPSARPDGGDSESSVAKARPDAGDPSPVFFCSDIPRLLRSSVACDCASIGTSSFPNRCACVASPDPELLSILVSAAVACLIAALTLLLLWLLPLLPLPPPAFADIDIFLSFFKVL